MTRIGAALLLVAGLTPSVASAEINGARLLQLCTARPASGCEAYVLGFADAESTLHPHRFCVPAGVPAASLRETLVAYLRAHPSEIGEPRAELTLHGFARAFPCPK